MRTGKFNTRNNIAKRCPRLTAQIFFLNWEIVSMISSLNLLSLFVKALLFIILLQLEIFRLNFNIPSRKTSSTSTNWWEIKGIPRTTQTTILFMSFNISLSFQLWHGIFHIRYWLMGLLRFPSVGTGPDHWRGVVLGGWFWSKFTQLLNV